MNPKLYDDDEDVNNLKLKFKKNIINECTNAPLKSAEKLSLISDAPPGDVILRELNQCTDAHCIKSLNYVHISTQIQKNATYNGTHVCLPRDWGQGQ